MCMRFERNISGAAAGLLARLFKRNRFGMFDFVVDVKPLTHYVAVSVGDHGADERPRTDLTNALTGELERSAHHRVVCLGFVAHDLSRRARRHVYSTVSHKCNCAPERAPEKYRSISTMNISSVAAREWSEVK